MYHTGAIRKCKFETGAGRWLRRLCTWRGAHVHGVTGCGAEETAEWPTCAELAHVRHLLALLFGHDVHLYEKCHISVWRMCLCVRLHGKTLHPFPRPIPPALFGNRPPLVSLAVAARVAAVHPPPRPTKRLHRCITFSH